MKLTRQGLLRRYFVYLSLIILCGIFVANIAQAELRDLPQITVLSASSLTNPITEISRLYSKTRNITVTSSFNASSELAEQVIEGDAGDIFISSHPKWIRELKQMGVIDVYSITNLVKNKLALVASKDSHFKIPANIKKDFVQSVIYLNSRTSLIVSDPDNTPLGIYTQQTLERLKFHDQTLWQKTMNNLIRTENSKKALYLIANGSRAGIIYQSDSYNNEQIEVINEISDDLHEPIIYQVAVVAGENMETARGFLDFLINSKEAKDIFVKYGFKVEQ